MTGFAQLTADQGQHAVVPELRGRAFEVAGLDAGGELDVAGPQLPGQKAIHLEGIFRIVPVDDGQGIEGNLMLAQQRGRRHHQIEGGFAAAGYPVFVVQCAGPVDGEADQKAVLLEKPAPLVIEQDAVGLQVVADADPGRAMLLLQRHYPAKVVDAEQGRFTALPGEDNLVAILPLYVAADEGLQRLFIHPGLSRLMEQIFLVQVEAILAINVALGAPRFGHDVEAAGIGAAAVTAGGFERGDVQVRRVTGPDLVHRYSAGGGGRGRYGVDV